MSSFPPEKLVVELVIDKNDSKILTTLENMIYFSTVDLILKDTYEVTLKIILSAHFVCRKVNRTVQAICAFLSDVHL